MISVELWPFNKKLCFFCGILKKYMFSIINKVIHHYRKHTNIHTFQISHITVQSPSIQLHKWLPADNTCGQWSPLLFVIIWINYCLSFSCDYHHGPQIYMRNTVFYFMQFWGRNRAPFTKSKSIFFHICIIIIHNCQIALMAKFSVT